MAEFGFSCWTYFSINRAWDTLAKDYCDLGLNMPLTPVFNEGDDPEKLLRLLDQLSDEQRKADVGVNIWRLTTSIFSASGRTTISW